MHITDAAVKRAWKIWKVSQTESRYREILMEARKLEDKFEDAVSLLPKEEENTVRDFVMLCEDMSWRMLQIACAMMVFPEEENR